MADEYIESGVPVLRGVNVNRGRFHDDDFVFISEPTAERLRKFESFPGDVLLLNRTQSRTLAELRDTLLPKLLSGELRVRDAEKAAAEVV